MNVSLKLKAMKTTQSRRRKRNYVTPSGIVIELEAISSILASAKGTDAGTGDDSNAFGIQLQDVDNTDIIP